MGLVEWQVGFGHRHPGAGGHAAFHSALRDRLRATGFAVHEQPFSLRFNGKSCPCVNYVVHLPARAPAARGPLLVGTHFDSRLIADREEDPDARRRPILGANDGGSGTAVLLHLLERSSAAGPTRDLLVAFFDAEDVGGIEGYEFSVGAERLAASPLPFAPEEVLVLDMIGGRGLVLDVDAHIRHHRPSSRLTTEIFGLAERLGMEPFAAPKPRKSKYIISDHTPFFRRGLPTCILIDIDYPEWHTHADLPQAMSGEALAMMEDLLLACAFARQGEG
jgi:glutaminyl-peptide cyclotransferase